LSQLDQQVQILLLGEARSSHSTAASQRLETPASRDVAPAAVRAYPDDGTWAHALAEPPLASHRAPRLARSRQESVSPQERADLRAVADGCDPLGGYVRMAVARWPPS